MIPVWYLQSAKIVNIVFDVACNGSMLTKNCLWCQTTPLEGAKLPYAETSRYRSVETVGEISLQLLHCQFIKKHLVLMIVIILTPVGLDRSFVR